MSLIKDLSHENKVKMKQLADDPYLKECRDKLSKVYETAIPLGITREGGFVYDRETRKAIRDIQDLIDWQIRRVFGAEYLLINLLV